MIRRLLRRRGRLISTGLMVVVFHQFLLIYRRLPAPSSADFDSNSIIENIQHNNLMVEKKEKLILTWNHYFSLGSMMSKKLDRQVLIDAKCPVTDCVFSDDPDMFDESDIVIFFAQALYEVPNYRFPHQRFVFFELESPSNPRSPTLTANRTRYDFFNWTMTYRSDSDIVTREVHGKVVPINTKQKKPSTNDFWRSKSKLVAWFVTNCDTAIRREEYVRQLSQFIPVDIYGKCGNLTCSKENGTCYKMLRNDYKFYLALENSWCPDYVTEKLFRPLYYDTVPIVMGGADYKSFAPPNSYINVADFESPRKLADYLKLLDQNDDLYHRYFDWKKDYAINLYPMDAWCELCRMAHDNSLKQKIYHDINQWWNRAKCKSTKNSDIFPWLQ